MNVFDRPPPKVTTGPLPGSRKVSSTPDGYPDVAVPLREIALSNGAFFPVYDPSGPYTDAGAEIDVQRGLPRLRAPWIEARQATGSHVTQLEFARAGIVTAEMAFVAHRENIGRQAAADEADARLADGEAFGASIPPFVTPEFVR